MSARGGEPRRLTYDTSNEDLPSWSRDGRWVYFHSDRKGSSQVWRMPINGIEEPTQVTYSGGLAAVESLDRKFVYYSKGNALGPASLWRVSTDSANRDETQVLESLADWSTFYVVAHGIYFIHVLHSISAVHVHLTGTSRLQLIEPVLNDHHLSRGFDSRLSDCQEPAAIWRH